MTSKILSILLLISSLGFGLTSKKGTFTLGASGDTVISGLGFNPNVVTFQYTSRIADGGLQSDTVEGDQMGFGVQDLTTQVAIGARLTTGSLNTDAFHDNTSCIKLISNNEITIERATCVLGVDSFTVTRVTGSRLILVNYTAMLVTAEKLVPFGINTSTADQIISGVGFAPNAVMFFTSGIATPNDAATNPGGHLGFGFAASASNEIGLGISALTSSNNDTGSQSTSKLIYIPDTAGMWLEGDIKSFDPDGVTLQYTTVQAGSVRGFLLFLGGVSANTGSFNQRTTNGDTVVSSIGFTPKVIGLNSYCLVSNTGQQNNARMVLGSTTSITDNGVVGLGVNVGNNQSASWFASNKAFECRAPIAGAGGTVPTLLSTGAISAIAAGTFTLSLTTTDATAREIVWYALGDAAAPPGGKRRVFITD